MYAWEAWQVSKQVQKKLEVTEMWFPRRKLRISWTAKKSSETVLREADTTRSHAKARQPFAENVIYTHF